MFRLTRTEPAVHRCLPALALTTALAVSGCGQGPAGTANSEPSGARSTASASAAAAEVAFLQGMAPHHEQAVEMSDIVLAAQPPAAVAALARQIRAAQAPEIEEIEALLVELGAEDTGEHGSGHSSGHGGGHGGGASGEAEHGGMLSEADLQALRAARGAEAARLYLEGMVAHHEGAVEASRAVLAQGTHAPTLALARRIEQTQTAEIARMRALLAAL